MQTCRSTITLNLTFIWFVELPGEVLYEIVKNYEQDINDTIRGCCGATLGKIQQSKPQASGDDDDGGVPLWGYIVAGVFGLVVLVGLAILAAVLVMRKKSVGTGSYYNNSGAKSTENLESK